MSKTINNAISIYLIKKELGLEYTHFLKENVKFSETESGDFVFYQDSSSNSPKWIKTFFNNDNKLKKTLRNSNSRALIFKTIEIEEEKRVFAIPFGYGKYLLKNDVVEERFGLKTALNLIGNENIRSINKQEISDNNKLSVEQMPKESTIYDFGFDIDGDLINGITGRVKDQDFIKGNVSGSDALKLNVPYSMDNIEEFLKEIYTNYLSDEYKTSFSWIDQISPVKSKELIETLDRLLLESVKKEEKKIYMAIPEVIRFEEIEGFQIPGVKEIKSDIELSDVLLSFKNKENINIKQFKDKYIDVKRLDNGEVYTRFSSYKCFIGEIEFDNKSFTISNGKWFQIDNNFVDEINRKYNAIEISNIDLPDTNKKTFEETYNKKVYEQNTNYFYLLDKKLVSHGGGYSKIEVCDLLTEDNKLIHVKKYGGSSVLSHLFNQGVVSARLIRSDQEFIEKANEVIDIERFKLNATENYEIVYGIISSHEAELPNIPFFSKVSLNNAKTILNAMNFQVTIKRIKENIEEVDSNGN